MFNFVSELTGQDNYQTFLYADWTNDNSRLGSGKDSMFEENDGFNNTSPTTDLIVLEPD